MPQVPGPDEGLSKHPPFGQGDGLGPGDDQVVEHPDVDEGEGVAQAHGDEFVRVARLGDARGVVVREDDRRGVMGQRLTEHFARMDRCAVDGAAEEFLEDDQSVAVVEVEAAEDLVWPVAQLRGEEAAGVGGGVQRLAGAQRCAVVSPRELERALQQGDPRGTESRGGEYAIPIGGEQPAQRAEIVEELAREIECADTAQTGAEQQCEQLRIRQRRRTSLQQFFARALGCRPMADGARGDRAWVGGLQVWHADSIAVVTHRRQR